MPVTMLCFEDLEIKTSRGRNIRCWQLLLKRYLTNDFIRQSSQEEPNSVWQSAGQPGAPLPFLAVGVAQAKAHILLLPIHGLVAELPDSVICD